jgi:serine/threonine-protein kinase HipA
LVPNFWLSNNGDLFVSERFDLREGVALGFEDMTVLMNKPSREKYVGSYENVAKAVRLYCADGDPVAQLQQLFEYIAFICMVRNGDGHLKNFGLIYDHPDARSSVRLAPLYDVVTTSIYGVTPAATAITKYDRTLALKLAKTRVYPDRRTLIGFGIQHCLVKRPGEVIERIADAMTATLAEQGERVDAVLLRSMREQWDAGMWAMAAGR